jgi:hypothetical protein
VTQTWTMPPGMTPSQALDDVAQLGDECIADDGGIFMTREDAQGFVELLRTIARAARITEQRADGAPSPILCGNVVGLRPRRVRSPWVVDGGGNVA